ncbi:MAG: sterol desaturase family protein [Chitinophagales bacterium]|jgi:sterol desaturase/sphingolipid hydroxylase (fatty acid hydroxylase superfamily)|nr:sterol desaturase family protein [Chitinophagales bacterium]
MKTNVYALLTPISIFFILLEVAVNYVYRKNLIRFKEFFANFGTALANQTVNVLVALGVYYTYGFLWENYRLIEHIEMNWLGYLLLLLGIDFIFYWVHRWGHHINIMWAAHSPHHSAEEMNFAVALRASVTQRLFSFFFFWPLTLIGFKPEYIYAMTAIHLFIAFLHHTELIGKLFRWIEFIFTTPSHHRVHHGVNYKYLDKNFSEFLIIWDRIFGTFEEEQEKVVYGMYHHPKTWNAIKINFHYYIILWNTAKAAPYFWDKIKLWFMPLTWTPRGLEPKPMPAEITPQNQKVYESIGFHGFKPYLVFQLIFSVWLMLLIITPQNFLPLNMKWYAALVLWHGIINWSGVMEAKKWTILSEMIRLVLLSYLCFEIVNIVPNSLPYLISFGLYFAISLFYVFYFSKGRLEEKAINA